MKTITLKGATLTLWRVWLCAVSAPVVAAAVLLWRVSLAFLALAAALFALTVFLFLYYLPRLHKSYKITLSVQCISVKRGVIIENEGIMPEPRLIATRRVQTPLSRIMGLSSLELCAARYKLFIPAVLEEDIQEIINFLGGD